MNNLSLNWWIDEYMIFCRSRQLREKTLSSYEQSLRLFERWCGEALDIKSVDKITEGVIRRYINDIQERGKYTFCASDLSKEKNFPERRRDYRQPVSSCTVNNYIRNLRAFFNWLDRDYILKKNLKQVGKQKNTFLMKNSRDLLTFCSDNPPAWRDYRPVCPPAASAPGAL